MDLQRLDGMTIEIYQGKITGNFPCDLPSQVDSEQYFVVRAHTKLPVFGETKAGDIKRTDVFAIVEVANIEGDVGRKLISANASQLSLLEDDEDDSDLEI